MSEHRTALINADADIYEDVSMCFKMFFCFVLVMAGHNIVVVPYLYAVEIVTTKNETEIRKRNIFQIFHTGMHVSSTVKDLHILLSIKLRLHVRFFTISGDAKHLKCPVMR